MILHLLLDRGASIGGDLTNHGNIVANARHRNIGVAPQSLEGMNESLYLLIDWSRAYLYIKKPAEITANSRFSRSDKLVF